VVVIDEVETDNWGIGGESVTVRRQRPVAPAKPPHGQTSMRTKPRVMIDPCRHPPSAAPITDFKKPAPDQRKGNTKAGRSVPRRGSG
jgi:hypothetical protein